MLSKLHEIEEQCKFALEENHVLMLARFIPMTLQGSRVTAVEELPENLRRIAKLPPKDC